MGQDVAAQPFQHRDFTRFAERLRAETERLAALCERDDLSPRDGVAGLELEAWLIHPDGRPAPANEAFLAGLALPTVVHELAKFNVELNVSPQPLAGRGLERLERELAETWGQCEAQAAGFFLGVIAIGTLPTVRDADLCPANMSNVTRVALSQRGLERWGVDADLAGRYLSIRESRARSGRTGADCQQRFADAAARAVVPDRQRAGGQSRRAVPARSARLQPRLARHAATRRTRGAADA
jgi:hypothetical protein